MNIQTFIQILESLTNDTSTKEHRRGFFLEHALEEKTPLEQLLFWFDNHKPHQLSDIQLSKFTPLLFLVSILLGIGAISGVMHYNGDAPVNIIYILVLGVFLPLVSILITTIGSFFIKPFRIITLGGIAEFILQHLGKHATWHKYFTQKLYAHYLFFIMQLTSFGFGFGIFGGFVFIVMTQDIAFGWSTTLTIQASTLLSFISTLSLPFSFVCPHELITLDLIEKSHYFRLGNSITQTMQNNAQTLGNWWAFLACALFFYSVLLRFFTLIFSFIQYKKVLKTTLLENPTVVTLLEDMNEPIISTTSYQAPSQHITRNDAPSTNTQHSDMMMIDTALGYSYTQEELRVALDALQLSTHNLYTIGGNNTWQEDLDILSKVDNDVALLVKSWEVPTMEFIDIIEELQNNTITTFIYPLGYPKDNYKAKQQHTKVWEEKLAQYKFNNVSIVL